MADNRISSRMIRVNDNDHERLSLEEYIKDSSNIPISYFYKTSVVQAIEEAISYLRNKGSGSVIIPPTYGYKSEVKLICNLNQDLDFNINYQTYGYRNPIGEESRPYTCNNWKVGDLVININLGDNKLYGWLCTKEGIPGVWKPLSSSSEIYSKDEPKDYDVWYRILNSEETDKLPPFIKASIN